MQLRSHLNSVLQVIELDEEKGLIEKIKLQQFLELCSKFCSAKKGNIFYW